MKSTSMRMPVATATSTKTSVGTYLAIAAIGGASFAAAMFMAAAQPAALAVGLSPSAADAAIVEGRNEVAMLNFDMAARHGDVLVDDLHLEIMAEADGDFSTIEAGINVADYIEQCSLYQNGVLNTAAGPVPPTLGEIVFSGAGVIVPQGDVENFEVKCNFANPSAVHTNAYAFALRMPNDTFVAAEEAGSGNILMPNQIIVGMNDGGMNTTPRQQVNVYEHGALSVELAPDTPASDIVLPSATDVVVGKWNINSLGESVLLEQLTFEMDPNSDNNVSLVHLELDNGASQSTIDGVVSAGQVVFNPNFEVLEGSLASLTLSIDTTASSLVAGGSGTSGERIRFSLDGLDSNSFEGTGTITGHAFTEDDLSVKVAAAPFVYRYTKPVVSLSALSPSGAAVPGLGEVLRFNVAANSAEDVTITSFAFKVNATDNAASGWNECTTGGANAFTTADFTLYNLTTDGTATSLETSDTDWSLFTSERELCSATPADLGYALLRLPQPEIVPAGETYTFALHVNTQGVSAADDDSLRFDIPETGLDDDSEIVNGITWDDGSGLLISGYLVDVLPVSGGTLIY